MARTSFTTDEASIVVSTDGYFDVYPSGDRSGNDRPAFRGRIELLDRSVRSADRLTVRPDSEALRLAVLAWSSDNGASAVRGDLGRGRDGNEVVPA